MIRTPSSLHWLVRRRARIQGLIVSSERDLTRLMKLLDRLPKLKLDLAAVDRIIRQHEIEVNPNSIPTVNPYSDEKLRVRKWFSHGEFSKTLLESLARCSSGPMDTRQLTQVLILRIRQRFPSELIDRSDELRLMRLVGERLKMMCRLGRVVRVNPFHEVKRKVRVQEWELPRHSAARQALLE